MTNPSQNIIGRDDILKIFTDGASRNNGGASACAYIFVKDDQPFYKKSHFLGDTTNNIAEYEAIIRALSEAEKYTRWNIEVYSDSELVIKQINKVYRIKKDYLSSRCEKVYALVQKFEKVDFISVSRSNKFIKQADQLCNDCINQNYGK
jgi:ribonuclease HI